MLRLTLLCVQVATPCSGKSSRGSSTGLKQKQRRSDHNLTFVKVKEARCYTYYNESALKLEI
jgi:hypothetical protein